MFLGKLDLSVIVGFRFKICSRSSKNIVPCLEDEPQINSIRVYIFNRFENEEI